MELIGFENTQLTALFLASRVEGAPYLPRAAAALVERYSFSSFPIKLEELSGERVSFRHGLFQDAAIETFDIYRDGIIVASKSPSELLDAFVVDVCTWMETAIGLKRIETHDINKNYESYLIVHSEAALLKTLDGLAAIQDLIARCLKSANGLEVKFHPVSFALSPDQTLISQMRPIPFRLERRAGVSFETNYYYSCAPLPTKDHLKVLERLEKLS